MRPLAFSAPDPCHYQLIKKRAQWSGLQGDGRKLAATNMPTVWGFKSHK